MVLLIPQSSIDVNLDRYLEQRDPAMHARAKVAIREYYGRNKKLGSADFTRNLKAHLKATVGETHWRKAHNYLEHFWKQKQKERARTFRQQPHALSASQSAPIPSFVEGGLGAPAGHTTSFKKDSKPKDPKPQSGDEKETGVNECVVCFEAPSTHVFVPCGHMCACKSCSSRLMESRKVCPMCNQSSSMAIKVFVP